jgi:hypothetical protein
LAKSQVEGRERIIKCESNWQKWKKGSNEERELQGKIGLQEEYKRYMKKKLGNNGNIVELNN